MILHDLTGMIVLFATNTEGPAHYQRHPHQPGLDRWATVSAQAPADPPRPALHILAKSGQAVLLPPLLLIKPESTYCEVLQSRSCQGQPGSAEVIAEKIKALFDPTDEGLLGMLLQL